MAEGKVESVLAASCGAVTTTALLIDLVGHEHRLVATVRVPSTAGPPWYDITVGIQQAVHQLETTTQRTLLTSGGRPITPRTATGQGADAFVAVSSAGPPLQVVLVGLMQDLTLASARRAAASTYTYITQVISLETEAQPGPGTSQDGHSPLEARMRRLHEGQPDVILLVGGTDGGAKRPVLAMTNLVSMALRVFKGAEPPTVLYAGNIDLRTEVADIVGPITQLKAVDNVRPTLELENPVGVQVELENLYIERRVTRLPGFQKLSNWTQYPITPTGKSIEKLVSYIGRQDSLNVLGVSTGSGATLIATKVRNCPGNSLIRSDAGVGHSLASLMRLVPVEKIQRWLPIDIPADILANHLLNKSLHPASLPATVADLMIEHAVAREALRLVVDQARTGWPLQPALGRRDIQWNLVIGTGQPLTGAPDPAFAALLLLDGLEPWGVTSLALDKGGAVDMLGAVALAQPVAAVEVAARDAFLNLGTVVAPAGHGQPGKTALDFTIKQADGTIVEVAVPYGSIRMIPLPAGQKASLEMRPARHFDVGLGQPGRGAVAEVEGGLLGIIIDARGRPLRLPKDDLRRQEQLQQWLQDLNLAYATSS